MLSVSKFANDNCVYFEFHPTSCFVKDLTIKTNLLKGQFKGGLYMFDNLKLKTQRPT